jgi:hypothetical protein
MECLVDIKTGVVVDGGAALLQLCLSPKSITGWGQRVAGAAIPQQPAEFLLRKLPS